MSLVSRDRLVGMLVRRLKDKSRCINCGHKLHSKAWRPIPRDSLCKPVRLPSMPAIGLFGLFTRGFSTSWSEVILSDVRVVILTTALQKAALLIPVSNAMEEALNEARLDSCVSAVRLPDNTTPGPNSSKVTDARPPRFAGMEVYECFNCRWHAAGMALKLHLGQVL